MRFAFGCAVCIVGLTASSGVAQQGRVAGPVLGYAFDSDAQVVRPVLGIPGASVVGSPVDFGMPITETWIAPGLDSAMVVGSDGEARLYRIDRGSASEISCNGMMRAIERVIFSPSGSAAVLYMGTTAQVIAGLPAAPVVAGSFDTASGAPVSQPRRASEGRRTSGFPMAVSDDASLVLFAGDGALRLFEVSGSSRAIADSGADASVVFAPGSHMAAVADSAGGVALIRGLPGSVSRQSIADAVASGPSVLAFSQDGRRLFITGPGAVTMLDLDSGSKRVVGCQCDPNDLARMGSVYRLNRLGAGPLWLLDVSGDPRTVFVPPVAPQQ